MSDVLIIGNGGREHALGWKLNQSPHVKKIFFASGNGGTSENISISPNEINKLLDFAKKKKCFIVVGPEEPLSKGIVNSFENNGLTIFGPRKEAAELETIWKQLIDQIDRVAAEQDTASDHGAALSGAGELCPTR